MLVAGRQACVYYKTSAEVKANEGFNDLFRRNADIEGAVYMYL